MADVESSNVVGYTGKTVEAGKYYLVGVQFNKTGDASGKVDMNDLISLSKEIKPGTYDENFVGAPEILVLNSIGAYDQYYYISDATDDNDDPLGYDCWADSDGYELTDTSKLSLATGFWFKSSVAGSLTVAGEVLGDASKVVTFPANSYFIAANPYPKAVSLADVVTTGITPGTYDDNFVGASEILTLNSIGAYDQFYYISDATDDNDDPVGYNCWADSDGYILNGKNQVEAGESFWIKGNAAGSLGFSL